MRNFKNLEVHNAFQFIARHRPEYRNYKKYIPKTYESVEEEDGLVPYNDYRSERHSLPWKGYSNGYINNNNQLESWWLYVGLPIDYEDEEEEDELKNKLLFHYSDGVVTEKQVFDKGKLQSITKYNEEGKYLSTHFPEEH
jgi:hypothetical protein